MTRATNPKQLEVIRSLAVGFGGADVGDGWAGKRLLVFLQNKLRVNVIFLLLELFDEMPPNPL